MMENKSDSLAKACKNLMLKEPFYGFFLMMLNKVWKDDLPTMGVRIKGIGYELLINESFWSTLDSDKQKGTLKHELMHIGLFHLVDYEHLSDKEIRNIAMDLEINQYIDKNWLPEGAVLLSSFPELKLESKKGTIYYYEKLKQARKNGSSPSLNSMLQSMQQGMSSYTTLSGGQGLVPDHSMWGKINNTLSEASKDLIRSQTQEVLRQVAEHIRKSRGTIPGEFSEILKRIEDPILPSFDWKGYLRRFAGGSTKIYTKKSRRKLNKRYSENPGLKIKQHKHVLVAIDTSGSVSTSELEEFMKEIAHINKTGSEITIIQCDTKLYEPEKFDRKKEIKIHGRGGTDFQPVINYYDKYKSKYTCLVYLTDGEAPAPSKPRGRVLWVLSSKSRKTNHLPGSTIKLNNGTEKTS